LADIHPVAATDAAFFRFVDQLGHRVDAGLLFAIAANGVTRTVARTGICTDPIPHGPGQEIEHSRHDVSPILKA
jgi:hypothetical protein